MMQLLEIVLYNYHGQKRTLSLRPGEVNIITGSSTTGKTALIDIVEYCLGRSFHIPEGIIRNTVAWYGIRLQFATDQLFIARQSPPREQASTNRVYVEQAVTVPSPDTAPIEPNTIIDAVVELLSQKLGISANLHTPPIGQTRDPLAANIKHAMLYCFQQQGEIANRDILFHRQSEDFMTQAIKDTLPYFLGAIQEDRLALEQELRLARRDLSRAERALREAELVKGEGISKAVSLAAEAQAVGILQEHELPETLSALHVLLNQALLWTPTTPRFPNADRLSALQGELEELQAEARSKADAIRAAKVYAHEAQGVAARASRQVLLT